MIFDKYMIVINICYIYMIYMIYDKYTIVINIC